MSKLLPGMVIYAKEDSPYRRLKPGTAVHLVDPWFHPGKILVEDDTEMEHVVEPKYFSTHPKPVEKIVITTDGTTTRARKYIDNKVVDEAVSKCSPDDTFDFDFGALLAMIRLMGCALPADLDGKCNKEKDEPKPSFMKGDFVKVKADNVGHGFPIGSVIQLKDWYTDSGGYWSAIGYSTNCNSISEQYVITEREVEFLSSQFGDTRNDESLSF